MERVATEPRTSCKQELKKCGVNTESWCEASYYRFTEAEVERIWELTADIYSKVIDTVEFVCKQDLFSCLNISLEAVPAILRSWERSDSDPTLCSRINFKYDALGRNLILHSLTFDSFHFLTESALVQWQWKESVFRGEKQSNIIYENLCDAFRQYSFVGHRLDFACLREAMSDYDAVTYLMEAANEAGVLTRFSDLRAIRWSESEQLFFDARNEVINCLVKSYPWREMITDPYANLVLEDKLTLVEPPWKMILESPQFIALLRERYSQNLAIALAGPTLARTPIIGSWIIAGAVSGFGVIECDGSRSAKLIPHIFH